MIDSMPRDRSISAGVGKQAALQLRTLLIRFAKTVYFSTPLWRFFLPVMKFDMTIAQLNFITSALDSVKRDGAVLEIGVGGGTTSIIINKFLKESAVGKTFYGIDTFYGFMKEDVDFEHEVRSKTDAYLWFRSNSKTWYEKTLVAYGIEGTRVIQADAKKLDYDQFAPLAFCLLDVDLYKPTKAVLPRLYDILVPGGIIIVDDCNTADSPWDGAGQAYREFCACLNITPEIVHDKLGVLRKSI